MVEHRHTKGSQDGRFRVEHRFWLDITQGADLELDDKIAVLKATRKFTRALRDGLRLIVALWAGEEALAAGREPERSHLRILEAMFPRVIKWIVDNHHAKELERLRHEVAELKNGVAVAAAPAPPPVRPQSVSPAKAPLFNLTPVKNDDIDPAANFIQFAKGMK